LTRDPVTLFRLSAEVLLKLSEMGENMEAGPGPGSAASRADGRTNLQIRFGLFYSKAALLVDGVVKPQRALCRTLLCERGLLQRADGSARWSQDKTSVLAAVYGPRTTLGRKEDSEQAVVEVIFKPKSGMYRYNAPGMLQDSNLPSLNRAQGDDFAYMVALPASRGPWITIVATLLVVQSVICVPCHVHLLRWSYPAVNAADNLEC